MMVVGHYTFYITFKLWYLTRDNSDYLQTYGINDFHICNKKWENHCLAKWGEGDEQTGTYENAKDIWQIIPASEWKEWIEWNQPQE